MTVAGLRDEPLNALAQRGSEGLGGLVRVHVAQAGQAQRVTGDPRRKLKHRALGRRQ